MTELCRCDFASNYERSKLPALKELERDVLGCDYGGTSWTTSEQVKGIQNALDLAPGIRLLEVGAGSGWPGLFLGHNTGCEVTLLDIPLNALREATQRAAIDQMSERVCVVAGSGTALPFADASYDRVSHSDVLCCLPEKLELLRECRRVTKVNGRMHFSVIRPASNLSTENQAEATEIGPPFVGADEGYDSLLAESGWYIVGREDVTPDYQNSLKTLVNGLNSDSPALLDAFGAEELARVRQHRQAQVDLIGREILLRETFVCSAS
jgi:SAM-dependent methyltransferase